MGITTRLSRFVAALGQSGVFIRPAWLTASTAAAFAVGNTVQMNDGTVTGLPVPTISYALAINGVAKTWPYVLQDSDVGLPYTITPTATCLGAAVPGPVISGTVPTHNPLYPTMDIGQNVQPDHSYATLRVFNDRVLAGGFYSDNLATVALTIGQQDSTTGMPLVAFSIKFVEGALATDPTAVGQYLVTYSATAQRNVSAVYSGTVSNHTFSGGNGQFIITYAGTSAMGVYFDGPVTALHCYDPTTASIWSTGGTPGLFNAQVLGTLPPYAYLRMMDLSYVNGDYCNSGGVWANDSVAWADRRTPASYYFNSVATSNMAAGMPIEWQVQLANAQGKDAWFNITELASDDYITQFATYVAQNLGAGQKAMFEVGNERWNTGSAFHCYRKAGYMGAIEVLAFQSGPTTEWTKPVNGGAYISTFQSDGTTATLVFSGGGHGLPIGATAYIPQICGANSGYTTFGGTGVATATDANTLHYPTTQPSTSGTVPATTVMASSGFLAINGTAPLFTGVSMGNIFTLSAFWHYRRVFQMAALVKAAFAAVGRSASDCQPVLALQAGAGASAQWSFGAKLIINFLAAQFPGVKMSDRLKAIAVGGYLQLDQGVINSGFGLTGLRTTPQDSASVLTQLKQMTDHGYACYSYLTTASWVAAQGLELWGYEIGLDTIGSGGQSTTTQNACTAANADPGIQSIITAWVQTMVAVGFKKIGWYTGGAGTYAGGGCFNLGQTAAEITASTPSASQSPKYKGLIAAQTAWPTPQPRHVFPCTLSGYDVAGNEAVTVVASQWPSFSGTNLPNGTFTGQGNNGQSYFVWVEGPHSQPCTVTVSGDYTVATAITISVQPCNTNNSGGGSIALSGVHAAATMGSCRIVLQPGPNYVFISASANAADVFPHTVDFAATT